MLVEGWNVGWDGDWFGNGNAMQFDTPTPDFDAAELTRYAKAKGVHLIGHHETGCAIEHYEAQLDAALDLFAEHGVSATSLQMIADAVGITKAAVYHQFRTKDHIVIAVTERELGRLVPAVERAEAGEQPGSPTRR